MKFTFEKSVLFGRMFVALALVLCGCLAADAQCNATQLAKLLPDDGADGDRFGLSVAISGNTAIVGALNDDDNGEDAGAAYLFDVLSGQQLFKLLPNDGATGDKFGRSVGISGTIAIIGADNDGDNGTWSGSAYLFDTTTGQQITKLLPNDGAENNRFGYSVAIDGTTAIVSGHLNINNGQRTGAAYLFTVSTGQQLVKLLADDGAAGDRFGESVAIFGTTAVIGAHGDGGFGDLTGSAYLFDVNTGQQTFKLLADDGAAQDRFGYSVAVSGTTAIIGALQNGEGPDPADAAYLFDTTTGQQIFRLFPNGETESFGSTVGISGTTAIVGDWADGDNGFQSGSAYLFDTTTGQQVVKFVPADNESGDWFGAPVAINGTTAIIGARMDANNGIESGSAYLFDVSCTDIVVPDLAITTRGQFVAGDAASLAESDNLDYQLQRLVTDTQSRTEFEVVGTSPTISPTSLAVTLEGAVFARSTVVQTIELWDFVAGVWELVDTRNATNMVDSTATVAATGDLSRFVDQTSLAVKARVHFQSLSARQRFASNTDQAIWTIGQ